MPLSYLQVSVLGLFEHFQMIVRPADVYVGADVVALHLHGHVEEVQSLREAALALKCVAHVVEQLGVTIVHLQARHEDLVLVDPVEVARVRLRGVGDEQRQQKDQRDFFAKNRNERFNVKHAWYCGGGI